MQANRHKMYYYGMNSIYRRKNIFIDISRDLFYTYTEFANKYISIILHNVYIYHFKPSPQGEGGLCHKVSYVIRCQPKADGTL